MRTIDSTRRLVRSLGFLGLASALLLGACSGGPGTPTATPGSGGPGATPGASGPAVTAGSGSSQAPGGPGATKSGSGSGSPAPGVTDEACTMLTAGNVEALLGATLVTAVPAQQLGLFTNGCLFEIRDDATASTTSVNLGAMPTGGRQYYDTQIAPTNTQNGYTPIQGLGDVAINARPGSVMAVAGDALIYVSYFGPTGPDQAKAAEIARQILVNLGH